METTLKQALRICALVVCGCAATAALSQEADGSGPYHFDCDAPLGKFQTISVKVPQRAFRVTGFFQIGDVDRKGMWDPQIHISLDETKPVRKISLVAMVRDSTIGLSMSKSRYVSYYAEIARSGGRIPFTLTYDLQGKVTGSVEDVASPAIGAASAIGTLTLACSSTHASFTEVTVVPLKQQ